MNNQAIFSYQSGQVFYNIKQKFDKKITPNAHNKVAERPDLILAHLRHLDLSGFELPCPPLDFAATAEANGQFSIGYYHAMGGKNLHPLK